MSTLRLAPRPSLDFARDKPAVGSIGPSTSLRAESRAGVEGLRIPPHPYGWGSTALGVGARRGLTVLLLAAAFVFAFWSTFDWMADRFHAYDSFYSHGWLIPFAGAWLIWQRRAAVRADELRPSFAGLALLIPSLLLHHVASWWQIHFLSGVAMLGSLAGLVWVCCGRSTLWVLRFPLLFLLFMIPLPGILLVSLSFKLKLLAAGMATQVLTAFGLPAVQAGSTIQVPGVSVIVDDTCSGLRSLISLLALSVLWTSTLGRGTSVWKKLTLVAASIPIALLANTVRILVLVLLAAVYGPQAAEGFLHYGSGLVVFGVALAALAGFSRTLRGVSS